MLCTSIQRHWPRPLQNGKPGEANWRTISSATRISTIMRTASMILRFIDIGHTASCRTFNWTDLAPRSTGRDNPSTDHGGGKRRSVTSQLHVSWATHLRFHHWRCGGLPKEGYPRCELAPKKKGDPIGGSAWNTLDGNSENFIRP
jgi:hypothetical protein